MYTTNDWCKCLFVTYLTHLKKAYKPFPAGFCDSTVGNFDVSPYHFVVLVALAYRVTQYIARHLSTALTFLTVFGSG